jgi:hypothetical protein
MTEAAPSAEDPPVDLDLRRALARTSAELVQVYDNLRRTQERCTELALKARDWRKKIIALGGEDPGTP